jgi:hypothetical protein
MKTINAMAEIDAEGWLTVHTRIPEKMEAGPVEAVIVLQPGQLKHESGAEGHGVASKQERMMECIRELRKLGPIAGMGDLVAWQRSIREDRDLCHGK